MAAGIVAFLIWRPDLPWSAKALLVFLANEVRLFCTVVVGWWAAFIVGSWLACCSCIKSASLQVQKGVIEFVDTIKLGRPIKTTVVAFGVAAAVGILGTVFINFDYGIGMGMLVVAVKSTNATSKVVVAVKAIVAAYKRMKVCLLHMVATRYNLLSH